MTAAGKMHLHPQRKELSTKKVMELENWNQHCLLRKGVLGKDIPWLEAAK